MTVPVPLEGGTFMRKCMCTFMRKERLNEGMESGHVLYPSVRDHFLPGTQRIQVACPLAVDLSNVPGRHVVPASGNRNQIFTELLSALSTLVNRHFCLLFPLQTEQKPQPFCAHQHQGLQAAS